MDREVLISISSLQFERIAEEPHDIPRSLDTENTIASIASGDYYFRGNKHYVLYDERMEENNQTSLSKNILKISSDQIKLTKKGISNTSMCFERNKKNISHYETPYGSFSLEIYTTNLQVKEQDNCIAATINYLLTINESYVSDCTLLVKIENRN